MYATVQSAAKTNTNTTQQTASDKSDFYTEKLTCDTDKGTANVLCASDVLNTESAATQLLTADMQLISASLRQCGGASGISDDVLVSESTTLNKNTSALKQRTSERQQKKTRSNAALKTKQVGYWRETRKSKPDVKAEEKTVKTEEMSTGGSTISAGNKRYHVLCC